MLPGQLPPFGSGRYEIFFSSGLFTPRPGVTRVRARVWAGGAGSNIDGGAASFGSMMSATGGTRGVGAIPGVGGQGVGGDFQASGGSGGAGEGGGGGASGSELGPGGDGGVAQANGGGGGGGAVGGRRGGNGGAANPGLGASVMAQGTDNGPALPAGAVLDLMGLPARPAYTQDPSAVTTPPLFIHPFVGFAFTGGGGVWKSNWLPAQKAGGEGAGGCGGNLDTSGYPTDGGHGGVFGGGGGAAVRDGSAKLGGRGGWMAEQRWIGGGCGGAKGRAGSGGGGYARGEFTVQPGVGIPVTVPPSASDGSGGFVVVEY